MQSKRQTMCPPSYYQSANGPMVTHALGDMGIAKYMCIYIYICIYIWIDR